MGYVAIVLLGLLVCVAPPGGAREARAPSAAAQAEAMRLGVERVLSLLSPSLRQDALRAFDDADRLDWHYTPRRRNGVPLKALDAPAREAVHALLRQALSAAGYRKIVNIIELEIVLREIELTGWMRDPERYHLTVYGEPSRQRAWGWRFEGHHLSLNFTLAGDRMVASTPSFLGANPAEVRGGPRKGLRALGAEEDEARALLATFTPEQRKQAIFDTRTYGDIISGIAPQANPLEHVGIPASRLDATQRAQLLKLIEVYAHTFESGLAEARLGRARAGGIEHIRFGWAGPTERGRSHYYRIQGPSFLIEYDASQASGNHIHTVWRDFQGDFGRDLLREHYAATRGTAHRH